ncbi:Kelch-like protein 17 [Eumeta japonica]|uniref:Kelch-like protein 17 n=1 Tax=Eumeta variegata TaxID=151549 RepID=A0A4C1WKH3_EUMVA|nr:Kelch-like protein 17 [Eumeta japonica]
MHVDNDDSGDCAHSVWEVVVPMETHRTNAGVASLDGRLYVVGGEDDGPLARGEVYDPVVVPCYRHVAVSFRGFFNLVAGDGPERLYLFASDSETLKRNSVNRMEKKKGHTTGEANQWSSIASMRYARSRFGLAALNGKLYAFGGLGDYGNLPSVEEYDPVADRWGPAGYLPQQMCNLTPVTYKEAVYLMHRTLLIRFDPRGDWRFCAHISRESHRHAAAVLDRHIYVVGGRSLDAVIERYSFDMCLRTSPKNWKVTVSILAIDECCDFIKAHALCFVEHVKPSVPDVVFVIVTAVDNSLRLAPG